MTVFDYIEQYAEHSAESYALDDGLKKVTYKQLYQIIKNSQGYFETKGIKSGALYMLKTQNQFDFIFSFLCLMALECWVVPVHSDIRQDEMQSIIDFTGAKVFNNQLIQDLKNIESFEQRIFNKPRYDNGGIYHSTSGTTGTPKLCIRTLEGLTAEAISYKTTFSITREDKILSAPPLYHSYAMGAAIMATLVSGGCLYLSFDRFVPRKLLKNIQDNRITILLLVPAMARALCNTYSEHSYNLSSLRVTLVGAGSITDEAYNNFKNRYNIILMSNYGSTETGGVISRLTPVPNTSIGKPMWGVEIKLCNEKGMRVTVGEEGEVRVKCDSMLSGYFGQAELPFDEEGFFSMGDIAVQDDEGNLYIKGRKKLIINVGGKKVNPYEVEDVLLKFPGVQECVVTGFAKANGEEAVKAFIVGDGLNENEICEFCSERLSKFKIPSIIVFTSDLPKNNLGKIIREELKRFVGNEK